MRFVVVDASRARRETFVVSGGEEVIVEVAADPKGRVNVAIVRDRLTERQLAEILESLQSRFQAVPA